ncbi:MAG TPA: beta-L-arabinofuranosidase domain-containing protein, partial [Candidatus Methylacidiphilales bacterium]|nr:beta-L-arabinofuranosidase domain-containing protein [Candidatus Methylacidiphilales bacterium]
MFRFKPVPFTAVTIQDDFWKERCRVNREQSLPKQYEMLSRTGRINALRLSWKPGAPDRPHIFWDSDTAKWLEAACLNCRTHPDVDMLAQIEEVAQLFIQAQQPDGYINSYFSVLDQDRRWKNLRDNHELYCAGHLFEAAAAHYDLTGKDHLLKAACRYADYIDSIFGPAEEGKIPGYCGHEEIELALIKLYTATGNMRYRKLAVWFVEQRGQQTSYFASELKDVPADQKVLGFGDDYYQAHKPVREQAEAVGHAVRAVYLYCAMADVARVEQDASLYEACAKVWQNLSNCKLYVTGGIGSSWHGEAFSINYDLPNERAYCETCAGVGLIFWAHRMLQHSGDAEYAEVMERALYNGALAGMSLDGRSFFYQNPLASTGTHLRQDWFPCSCCPSNLSRLLGTLGQYIYSISQPGSVVWPDTAGFSETRPSESELAVMEVPHILVHLYINSEAQITLPNGTVVTLRQTGTVPWGEQVQLEVVAIQHPGQTAPDPVNRAAFTLTFRVPGWASLGMTLETRNCEVDTSIWPSYLLEHSVSGTWRAGSKVELTMPMPIRRLVCNPLVTNNNGCVALQRGPFIYCVEDADYEEFTVLQLALAHTADISARHDPQLLGGVTLLEAPQGSAVMSAFPIYNPDSVQELPCRDG